VKDRGLADDLPLTIAGAAASLRAGRIKAADLTEALLERSHRTQAALGAFTLLCDTGAREAARRADEERVAGLDRGPLHGIPIAVKDNITTIDAPTTAGSAALDPLWEQGDDATVVRRLREAGAVILGKLVLYEFAVGTPDPDRGFRDARNPWDLSRIPGGSSSGAGAAVAAGLVPGALGTDTGGSIRVPASYCGLSGLRPTFGWVSNHGSFPVSHSFDTIGPLAHTAEDCALLLDAIAGHDRADSTTSSAPYSPVAPSIGTDLASVRVGMPRAFLAVPQLDAEVRDAVMVAAEQLAGAGATLVDIELPHLDEAYAAWWAITFAEKYSYHETGMQQHPERYGAGARRSILTGTLLSATDYLRAQAVRAYVAAACARALADIDILLLPCTIGPAPVVEDWDHFTTPSFTALWSLLGYPALSVCCGFTAAGLPIGMQIVGKPFAEALVLGAGHEYQCLTDWHTRLPALAKELD
jgi:aspartyl-tRNA(Asn)/glutamyl-tRNA(Gln) amidotransferase subunit A